MNKKLLGIVERELVTMGFAIRDETQFIYEKGDLKICAFALCEKLTRPDGVRPAVNKIQRQYKTRQQHRMRLLTETKERTLQNRTKLENK